MYKIDLNCDLGESFGVYKIGMDHKIIPYITSANIACGFHASDPIVMDETVKLAADHKVSIGAHPGYADLVGFGRRNMNITPKEAKAMMQYQIGALLSFCSVHKVTMQHVKPHGAFYNMACKDTDLARAVCEGIYEVNPKLILLAQSGSKMIQEAEKIGLKTASEVFADRAYEDDGTLVARTKPGAMITDSELAIQQVISMIKEGKVKTINGRYIDIKADSVCVHGDGANALEFVSRLREVFDKESIEVVPISRL
ncbi:MAG: LamB/YcsF family protein [Lachnotalea sp.]